MTGRRKERGEAREPMARRRAARLAAVQALYQLEIAGGDPAIVTEEFLERAAEGGGAETADMDVAWFRKVVTGAWSERLALDAELATALAAGWTLARCAAVTRAILRAGAFELRALSEVPAKVVINEYVEITHLFSGGGEPGFVHAVLDRLAGRFRGSGEVT